MTTATPDTTRPDYVIAQEELDALLLSLALPFTCSEARASVESSNGVEHVTLRYTTSVGGSLFEYGLGIGHIPWNAIKVFNRFGRFEIMYKMRELRDITSRDAVCINKYKQNSGVVFSDQARWGSVCAIIANATNTKPRLSDVVASVAHDAEANDMSFDGFCEEYGYDNDSRAAEKTYEACCDNARKLSKIMPRNTITKIQAIASRL